MVDISVAGLPASCASHTQTGSSRVTIGGAGVCRVEADSAGGLIIGPGSQSVFVEGFKVSLTGDSIMTHGKSPHASAKTTGQGVVTATTGFASITGDSADAPSPELSIVSFTASKIALACSGQGVYPPTNMQAAYNNCSPGGTGGYTPPPVPTVTYTYTVTNTGNDPAQPFVVGFWRFLDMTNIPGVAILTIAANNPDAQLYAEQPVASLAPGASVTGTFQYNEPYFASIATYAFGIYADIYNTTTEQDENNSAATITITVNDLC